MSDRIVEIISSDKVFEDAETGRLYFIKTIRTYKFITINPNGEEVYSKTPSEKTEPIFPETLGFTKRETEEIFVFKTIQQTESLSDEKIYFSLELNYEIPNEPRYKTFYFYKCKSGRVMLKDFASSCTSEVGVNNTEFCKRGKTKKLLENTLLRKDARIFQINSSGELEQQITNVW